MLVNIVAFVFVLGVLVVLHEAGHFLAARILGAPVAVFSVGFGKRIWGFERGGTDYRVSMIPLGGYVRVIGLGPDESDVVGDASSSDDLLPRWKRALILLAGPVTNVIAAVCFLAVAYMVGIETPMHLSQPPVVGWVDPSSPAASAGIQAGDVVSTVDGDTIANWRDLENSVLTSGGREIVVAVDRNGERRTLRVTPEKVTRYEFGYAGIYPPLDAVVVRLVAGSPAKRAGLQPGDRIVAVNEQPVEQFWDLIRLISPHPGEEITVTFVRGGETSQLKVVPQDDGGEGKIGIGLAFPSEIQRMGPAAALRAGVKECGRMTRLTFGVIGKLLTRKASIRQVSGPVDIARISGDAARSGLHTLVWLMGLISLQLGIFNLLPIPILDGGHLTIIAFESAIRRDLSIRVKERILEVGFYLLILLMVVVLFNDIVKVLPESVYRFISRG
jgi:regulator of sigma E protease